MPSTVWVDSRTGSRELLTGLRRQGLTAELTTLDAADFAFTGNGPAGECQVGIERKALGDLVSSLRSGRLQGRSADERSQLDRLHKTYDVVWLLVEGVYTTDRQGSLVSGRRRLSGGYSEDSLTKALLTLELRGGLHIHQTTGPQHSARWLASLFRWWTDKAWDKHSTLHAPMKRESVVPLSEFREAVLAMRLPGVGIAASLAVEKACMLYISAESRNDHPSLTSMLNMTEFQWAQLEVLTPAGPRRLGGAKASRIVEAIRRLR